MTEPIRRPVAPGLLGPVFRYELVRLGRQRATFLIRGLYLLTLLIVLTMAYVTWADSLRDYTRTYLPGERRAPRLSDYSSFGTILFRRFMPIQFFALAALTPGLVAGTIAVEKERKTLEFMLATDLRNREIVFGKLVARLVTLFMYALAGLPVIGIAMMFGGIDPNLLYAGYGATILTLFGLASLSVFFSVTQRKSRDAIALTYVVALAYLAMSFFAGMYMKFVLPRILNGVTPTVLGIPVNLGRIADWVAAGNPIYAAIHAAGPGIARGGTSLSDLVVRYALFHLGGGSLLLAYSIRRLRTVALRQAYGGTTTRVRRERSATAKPAVGGNPILWREVFCDSPRGVAWLVLNLLLLGLVFVWPLLIFLGIYTDFRIDDTVFDRISYRFDATHWEEFVDGISAWVRGATGVVTFLVCFAAALRGAGAVTAEKDKDTWTSLIATPVGVRDLVWGKFWGCLLAQRRLVLVLLLVWAFGLAVGAVHPLVVPFLVGFLAVYLTVFAWVGMAAGATARNTTTATLRTIVLAGFLIGGHFIVGGLCCIWPMTVGNGSSRVPGQVASLFVGQIPPFVMGWLALPKFDRDHMGIFHPNAPNDTLGLIPLLLGIVLWTSMAVAGYRIVTRRFQVAMNRVEERVKLG